MSRHVVPPSSLDDLRIVWIQPDPDPKADPGWRLRLDWMDGDNAFLFEEQVLPERVDMPNAKRILVNKASIQLTRENAEWLRDALVDFLGNARAKDGAK